MCKQEEIGEEKMSKTSWFWNGKYK